MLLQKLIHKSFEYIDLPDTKNKHFSYLIRGNKILSFGFSSSKTHPLAKRFRFRYPSTHAELHAIARFPAAPSQIKFCNLYNIRINKKGKILLSKPCFNCQMILLAFRPKQIFYTTSTGDFKQWKFQEEVS